jgi:hypothetical protein
MDVPVKGKERTREFQWLFFVGNLGTPSSKFLVHKPKTDPLIKLGCVSM